jgi:hypothetical protein
LREWLNAQAASGYVRYRADEGSYELTPEQALAFADEDSPASIVGAFETTLAASRSTITPIRSPRQTSARVTRGSASVSAFSRSARRPARRECGQS